MSTEGAPTVAVVDYRRQNMLLEWHILDGTWSAYDTPPSMVHGIALIRPGQPNICIYARGGELMLQLGSHVQAFTAGAPRIRRRACFLSFGLRERFTVESSGGEAIFSHAYWVHEREEFFAWITARAQDPEWRQRIARQWSDGLSGAALRANR